MDFGWEEWQLIIIDEYLLGYSDFENQMDLSDYLGKTLNSVKIKLSRRRKEIDEQKRKLTNDEYITFLSNRFNLESKELAQLLNISSVFLLDELDELDNLECKEYLLKDYDKRPITNEEYELFVKLKTKGKSNIVICHLLNRPIKFIEELSNEFEYI